VDKAGRMSVPCGKAATSSAHQCEEGVIDAGGDMYPGDDRPRAINPGRSAGEAATLPGPPHYGHEGPSVGSRGSVSL
jgi:hypothetical protein